MKRINGCTYLYGRGGSFVFRRSVPLDARSEFGGRVEVQKVLPTKNLAEARHCLADALREFEATLAMARGTVAPIDRVYRQRSVPSLGDMEYVVRGWLTDRNARFDQQIGVLKADEEESALADLSGQRAFLDKAAPAQTVKPSVGTDWIAQHLIEQSGWEIDTGTNAYRHLQRLIVRGQIEANARAQQLLSGEPGKAVDDRFSPDRYRMDSERAPPKRQVSLKGLIDGYITERKPAASTIKAYRGDYAKFCQFIGHDRAEDVSPSDIVRWKDELQSRMGRDGQPLSPRTIGDKYLAVVKTVMRWAADNHHIATNPAEKVTIRRGKKVKLRERDFTDAEAQTILTASLQSPGGKLTSQRALAQRWVPWLCAYTGARVNEITQLRAEDVERVDGVWVIRITPEAGSVKTHEARLVPLHQSLIEQGFLAITKGKKGPLFFNPDNHRGGGDGNPQSKKTGEFLARWVRSIGVTDPNVAPNHGWRHRFKTLCHTYGVPEGVQDAIQGHSQKTDGRRYGQTEVGVMAVEVAKFPDFRLAIR